MKHYFHFIFTIALVMGSLILLGQKNEASGKGLENDGLEQMELLAEICFLQNVEYAVPFISPGSKFISVAIQGHLKNPDFLHTEKQRLLITNQTQIHLRLKPVISNRCCSYFQHPSGHDDPPLS